MPYGAEAPRLYFALEAPLFGDVLKTLQDRYAQYAPLHTLRVMDSLCTVEETLLHDVDWPLNLKHVAPLAVKSSSFRDICARAADAISKAYLNQDHEGFRWKIVLRDSLWDSSFHSGGEPPRGNISFDFP
jgi:hypothetical protein